MSEQLRHLLQIPQIEQRSEDWYKWRSQYLTSSDVASVLGMDKYKSREHVLFRKCGVQDMFVGNEATEHGQKYEDEALDIYGKMTGRKIYSVGLIEYSACHDDTVYNDIDCKFLAGSADGLSIVDDNLVVVEVKSPYRRRIRMGEIPSNYLPQIYMNMFILNVPYGDFVEYVPQGHFGHNIEMNIVRVYLDREWLNWAIPILRQFWDDVLYYRENGIETFPNYENVLKKNFKNRR